ncbi:hypothetical protein [Streptomyces sp. NPDC000878]
MPGRFEYERAIRRSDLPPPSRHLALTIATWADMNTGIIPDRFQPSLGTLEAATGMGRKTVRTHLDVLEEREWLERHRPDKVKARTEHARTRYVLIIPDGARGGETLGLGAEEPQPEGGETLGKGRTAPRARGGEPPKSPSQSQKSPEVLSADEGVATATPRSETENQDEVVQGEIVDDADAPVTAQTIVGEWLERCAKRPPSRVIGQVAKQIKTLLDENIDADDIRRGLAAWMVKGYAPGAIPTFVNEAMNASPPARATPSASTGPGYDPATGTTVFDRARARAAARQQTGREGLFERAMERAKARDEARENGEQAPSL